MTGSKNWMTTSTLGAVALYEDRSNAIREARKGGFDVWHLERMTDENGRKNLGWALYFQGAP